MTEGYNKRRQDRVNSTKIATFGQKWGTVVKYVITKWLMWHVRARATAAE